MANNDHRALSEGGNWAKCSAWWRILMCDFSRAHCSKLNYGFSSSLFFFRDTKWLSGIIFYSFCMPCLKWNDFEDGGWAGPCGRNRPCPSFLSEQSHEGTQKWNWFFFKPMQIFSVTVFFISLKAKTVVGENFTTFFFYWAYFKFAYFTAFGAIYFP